MTITLNGTTGISNDGGYTGDGVSFADTTPANTLVTTTGGNVGIGTSSPSYSLDVATAGGNVFRGTVSGVSAALYISGGIPSFGTTTNTAFKFITNDTERMRIDSSGNLLVNNTSGSVSGPGAGKIVSLSTTSGIFALSLGNTASTSAYGLGVNSQTGENIYLYYQGAYKGLVSTSAGGTTYGTASDYRLKDITGDLTGYKERIMALQPKQGSWKSDGSVFKGFIAHEFAEQYPNAVSGEKDAVDAEGKPMYQGMQAGGAETIADLVALVKELVTELDTVKAEVTALKGTA